MLDLENMDDARERILNELQRNNVYLNPSPPSLEDKCLARFWRWLQQPEAVQGFGWVLQRYTK